MKALEMLYRDKKWIEEECDISKITIERVQTTIKDLVEINEAIAELEVLEQHKSCKGCRYYTSNLCPVEEFSIASAELEKYPLYCNRHKPKEQ